MSEFEARLLRFREKTDHAVMQHPISGALSRDVNFLEAAMAECKAVFREAGQLWTAIQPIRPRDSREKSASGLRQKSCFNYRKLAEAPKLPTSGNF